MAVGRGSMERAAKAAGTDTAAKRADDKAQSPYRRLTISEIVGETSTIEPSRPRKAPADKPASGGRTALAGKPAVRGGTGAVKSEPATAKLEVAAVEEPKLKAETTAAEELKLKVETAATEGLKSKAETAAAESTAKAEVPAVLGTKEETKPVAQKKALVQETGGQIIYQKSNGMLERAAEPNERFGLGDAMPVYFF